jgi:hypothetical protein
VVQELCLSILIFRENRQREDDRAQGALRAAVAAGRADPEKAWPEYFAKPAPDEEEAFPSADADMSRFTWEQPDQERMTEELEQLMHGARVTLREDGAAPAPPPEPQAELRPMVSRMGPADPAELEWG